jgi:hypothetical protein
VAIAAVTIDPLADAQPQLTLGLPQPTEFLWPGPGPNPARIQVVVTAIRWPWGDEVLLSPVSLGTFELTPEGGDGRTFRLRVPRDGELQLRAWSMDDPAAQRTVTVAPGTPEALPIVLPESP